MNNKLAVGLIGAGSMGGALMRAWLDAGIVDVAKSAIFDPGILTPLAIHARNAGVPINPPKDHHRFDCLVIAVKPQVATEALAPFAEIASKTLCLSIMAGKAIESIKRVIGEAKVIRAMPNLPASIAHGASGLYAPDSVSLDDRQIATRLMSAAGIVEWVDSEDMIDAVTAVSGSGPAYVFALLEALARAGAASGLSEKTAMSLARHTIIGAGAMLAKTEHSAHHLRVAVTSPGGTTAAALNVLQGRDATLDSLVEKAVIAAKRRAGELTD